MHNYDSWSKETLTGIFLERFRATKPVFLDILASFEAEAVGGSLGTIVVAHSLAPSSSTLSATSSAILKESNSPFPKSVCNFLVRKTTATRLHMAHVALWFTIEAHLGSSMERISQQTPKHRKCNSPMHKQHYRSITLSSFVFMLSQGMYLRC